MFALMGEVYSAGLILSNMFAISPKANFFFRWADDAPRPSEIDWPIEKDRLLMPTLRGGRAVWVVRSADRIVSEIGELCPR